MDETKLLRKVCQGNQKAFEQIMEHPDREIFLRHYYYYTTLQLFLIKDAAQGTFNV